MVTTNAKNVRLSLFDFSPSSGATWFRLWRQQSGRKPIQNQAFRDSQPHYNELIEKRPQKGIVS